MKFVARVARAVGSIPAVVAGSGVKELVTHTTCTLLHLPTVQEINAIILLMLNPLAKKLEK